MKPSRKNDTKKPRGRPRTGIGTPIMTRLSEYQLEQLDDWRERQERTLTRPAALRELMMIGILHARENDGKASRKRGKR